MEHEGFSAISKSRFVWFVWFVVNSLPKPYVHAFVVEKGSGKRRHLAETSETQREETLW